MRFLLITLVALGTVAAIELPGPQATCGDCNDNNPCTDDVCDQIAGCQNVPDDTNACAAPGGDACQVGACQSGACVAVGPVVCPADNVECTEERCVPGVGCIHEQHDERCPPAPDPLCGVMLCRESGCIEFWSGGNVCTDYNECTTNDRCFGNSRCQPGNGPPPVCTGDDGNPCTINDPASCVAPTGCRGTPVDSLCDDGSHCTTDACGAQGCVHTVTMPPAAPVGALRFDSNDITVRWDIAPYAQFYDVIRGLLTDLPVFPPAEESCFRSGLTGPFFLDTSTPSSGTGYWYLVRSQAPCTTPTWGWTGYRGIPWSERLSIVCP